MVQDHSALIRRGQELRRQQEEAARQQSRGRLVPTRPTKTEKKEEKKKGSRFGFIADAFRDVVPEEVRDVAGAIGQNAFSGTRFLDTVSNLPSPIGADGALFGRDLGTRTREKIEETPHVGGALGSAFDVATAPGTIATAAFGGAAAGALRGLGPAGRIGASLVSPIGNTPAVRLFSEVAMGTGGELAADYAQDKDAPAPVVMASALAGGVLGLWGGNVARGGVPLLAHDLTRNVFRGTPKAIAQEYGLDMGGRTFLPDLRPFDQVQAEVRGAKNEFEETALGRGANAILNPSKNYSSELAINVNAFRRVQATGTQLADVNARAAVGAHNPQRLFRVGKDGMTNVLSKDGRTPSHWHTIFETKDPSSKYLLNDKQRAAVQDSDQFLEDLNDLRVKNGLEPLWRTREGKVGLPRIVRGVRGLEVHGLPDSHIKRVFEDIEDGVRNGIDYENDIAAVHSLYAQSTYREIAQQQLDDAMAPYLVSPADIRRKTHPDLVQRRINAAIELRDARNAVKEERRVVIRERADVDKDILREAEKGLRKPGEAPSVRESITEARNFKKSLPNVRSAQGKPITEAAATRLDNAKREAHRLDGEWRAALRKAQASEVAPGWLFGKAEKDISVGKWKGKFLPKDEDYLRLSQEMNVITGRPNPVNLDPFTTGARDIGNAVRFMSATGDVASPFTHGLALMGQNPVRWANMAVQAYHGFLDPNFSNRWVRDHLQTVNDMARYGVPVADVETFSALKEGALNKPLQAVAKSRAGKQTLGRAEAALDTSLTAMRGLQWESLKPHWDGTMEELATHVKNTSGGLDSAALGVGATRRAWESVWMGFSPRLMRSTIALVAKAGNPNSAAGRQAARSLLGLAAFGSGMAVLTNIAIGRQLGETDDQIKQRIKDTMDPLGGRKFLSVKIGDQYIGVGGQVRAISQFVAKAVANPSGFTTADQYENPLINYYMSRGAVGVNLVGGAVEAATGERVNVLSFESVDSVPDLVEHVGTSMLPFAIQAQIEAEDVSTLDRVTMAALGSGGLNVGQPTAVQQIDELAAQEYGGRKYQELTGVEQQRMEEQHADLFELRDKQRSETGGREARQKREQLDLADTERLDGERMLVDAYARGVITGPQFRDEMKAIQRDAVMKKSAIRGDEDYETTDENKLALTAWYNTFDEARIEGTEIVDWDTQEALERDLFETLTATQRRYVDERRKTEHAPEAAFYFANEDVISESDYWSVTDAAFDRFKGRMPQGIETYSQLALAFSTAKRQGELGDREAMRLARRLNNLKNAVDRFGGRQKEQMRRRDPVLDRALLENGRTTTLLSRQPRT